VTRFVVKIQSIIPNGRVAPRRQRRLGAGENFPIAQVAPALAFLTLALYAAVFLAIPALITRQRDIV
jgi:hypothetical protein